MQERDERKRRAEELIAKHKKETEPSAAVPIKGTTVVPPVLHSSVALGTYNTVHTAGDFQHALKAFPDSVVRLHVIYNIDACLTSTWAHNAIF